MSPLTVLNAPTPVKKKVLLTTPLYNGIVPLYTNRRKYPLRINQIDDKDDLLQLCMNAEHQYDIQWPYGGIELIKANVPSVDLMEYPSMAEYEAQLEEVDYDVVAFTVYRKDLPVIEKMVAAARERGVKEFWAGNYGANSPGMEKIVDHIYIHEGVSTMKPLVEGEEVTYRRHPVLMDTMMRRVPVGYLYTSVGCLYRCKFCSTRVTLPDPYFTPIEEIRRVLDVYVQNGVRTVSILDETFMQDRAKGDEVIEELHKRDLYWHCTTRINLLKGRIDWLRSKGMKNVYVGVESLVDSTLRNYSKGQNVQAILDIFKQLNDNGVNTTITYIFGFETDTKESILEAIDLIKTTIRPFCLSVLVLTPYPNSEMKHIEPLIFDHDPLHWDSQHLVWEHPNLTPEDIRELLWIAHQEVCSPINPVKKRLLRRMRMLEKANGSALWSSEVDGAWQQARGNGGESFQTGGSPAAV